MKKVIKKIIAAIGSALDLVAGAVIVLVGMVTIAWGVYEMSRPHGLIIAGIELIAIGCLIDRMGGNDGNST